MRESGVTLLELLVTMTIIMVLASVALPISRVSAKRTHEIELRQHLRNLRAAIGLVPRLAHVTEEVRARRTIIESEAPQTVAIEEEPLDSVISETSRMV